MDSRWFVQDMAGEHWMTWKGDWWPAFGRGTEGRILLFAGEQDCERFCAAQREKGVFCKPYHGIGHSSPTCQVCRKDSPKHVTAEGEILT